MRARDVAVIAETTQIGSSTMPAVLDSPAVRFGLGVSAAVALMISFIGWGGERTGARAPEHKGTAAVNWRDQKPHGRSREIARRQRQIARQQK